MGKKGKKFLFLQQLAREKEEQIQKDKVLKTDTKAHPRKMEEAGGGY